MTTVHGDRPSPPVSSGDAPQAAGGRARRPRRVTTGYRGPDRRPRTPDGNDDVAWTRAGLALVTVTAAVSLLAFHQDVRQVALPLASHFRVASVALAVVLAAASYAVWRVTGEVRGCRIATVAWLLAAVSSLDLVGAAPGSSLDAARWVTSTVAAGWVVWTTRGPDVDSRARAPRDLARAGAATGLLWVLAAGLLPLAPGSPRTATLLLPTLAATAWLVATVAAVLTGRRDRSYLRWWSVWALGGIALADVGRAVSRAELVADLPSSAVRLGALLLATLGTVAAIGYAATGRRSELHRAMLSTRRRDEDRRSDEAEHEHEVRNALLAVEGATHILQRHRGELPPAVEAQLTETIAHQLAALRELVVRRRPETTTASPSPGSGAHATVAEQLAQVVREQVTLARTRGLAVGLELSELPASPALDDLDAVRGVLNNLLRNAEVHGRGDHGAPIEVELAGDDLQVRLSVRDHGAGIADEDLETIFARGGQLGPASHGGDGLGLFVARRAVRAMGGDLRFERPVGGGARFVASFAVEPPGEP